MTEMTLERFILRNFNPKPEDVYVEREDPNKVTIRFNYNDPEQKEWAENVEQQFWARFKPDHPGAQLDMSPGGRST